MLKSVVKIVFLFAVIVVAVPAGINYALREKPKLTQAQQAEAAQQREADRKAREESARKRQAATEASYESERTLWVMAQDFASNYQRGEFDTNPRSVKQYEPHRFIVQGDLVLPNGNVSRVVAYLDHKGGGAYECPELYVNGQQYR